MADDGYLLADAPARRLAALAAIFDPVTRRHVTALGVPVGGACWEVGAGGTTVVRWLAEQVGPGGRVLATDIDVTSVMAAAGAVVDVRRHAVGVDPTPDERFDLVHARLVLVHVPERDDALATMAEALAPGGWLLAEEADPALQPLACLDPVTPDDELANRLRTGFRTLMSGRGVDLTFGRTLPRRLRQAGLVDVAADAYFPVARPECNDLELATIETIRHLLVDHGIATEPEIERHLASVAAGRLDLAQPPLVSAWGRKP
ncbi:MAG TPA: methyltransferase [Acidimicrobiales bacterium]|nr:methyltransferase [Acidimicrobiales bacterium]